LAGRKVALELREGSVRREASVEAIWDRVDIYREL
jgi:hypothetical protein